MLRQSHAVNKRPAVCDLEIAAVRWAEWVCASVSSVGGLA